MFTWRGKQIDHIEIQLYEESGRLTPSAHDSPGAAARWLMPEHDLIDRKRLALLIELHGAAQRHTTKPTSRTWEEVVGILRNLNALTADAPPEPVQVSPGEEAEKERQRARNMAATDLTRAYLAEKERGEEAIVRHLERLRRLTSPAPETLEVHVHHHYDPKEPA